ncbi:thiamine diphosphokinase [Butyrivibrio sp. YAB3001]|uniref:thiamine diphosphokinase n=1 Tax=Butyrivibrio sp. YAB3001 TaxID=1520812 RepID=UPI0008F63A7F|nr:thiamine diphosphokinase [Butyrivibrio sp. YAB3001]SFD02306.1 thiamine pyrophosphokinase [Butyrivibrio sp. YAB3001]
MDREKYEQKCIIISAGSFVPMEIPISDGDYVIACDAGFSYAQQMGILPDLIVGDFDSAMESGPLLMQSLEEIEREDPDRIIRLDVRKDDTDTIKAVKIGLAKGFRKFFLYGALGGRRIEHSFANVQTLLYIKHHGGKAYIMDHDRILMVAENETIKFHRGNSGYLSIFSLTAKSKGVTLKGLMYSMDDGEITNDFPLGVSNEFIIDEEAEITVRDGSLLIVAEI